MAKLTALLPRLSEVMGSNGAPGLEFSTFELQSCLGPASPHFSYNVRVFSFPPNKDPKKCHGPGMLDRYHYNYLTTEGVIEPRRVYIKWAFDDKRITKLLREASWYTQDLKELQGQAVPHFYGFFSNDSSYPTVACTIFELLEHTDIRTLDRSNFAYVFLYPQLFRSTYPQLLFFFTSREIMLAGCKIHRAGISHNALISGYQKGSHIISTPTGPMFVDFTQATRHKCLGAHPCSTFKGISSHSEPEQCKELANLEISEGFIA